MFYDTETVMLSVLDYLALNDDERYAEMRRATIAAMSEDMFNKCFKPTKHRWRDLARVWDKVLNHSGWSHLTLASVIHKFYWGVLPYEMRDIDTKYLYSLIEAELLSDGEGFRDLSSWVVFKRTLDELLSYTESLGRSDIDTHFIEHHYYLKSRAMCKLIYDKAPLSDCEGLIAECRDYEEIIHRLIPNSGNWSYAQWGDDTNIADALYELYGVDYAESHKNERDYERLIMMLTEEKYQGKSSEKFVWCAANISELPLSLAQVIWKTDIEKIVADVLWAAYERTIVYEESGETWDDKNFMHPFGHYDRRALKESWLFKLASQWFYENVYTAEQYERVKAVVFDLTLSV